MENRNTEGAERDPPRDAAAAIEDLLGFELHDDITERTIDHVKMGTTVATSALLEEGRSPPAGDQSRPC
jgi:N-methylhydantoinase A/oxoprolinase/acetone carboxylase beta subunit